MMALGFNIPRDTGYGGNLGLGSPNIPIGGSNSFMGRAGTGGIPGRSLFDTPAPSGPPTKQYGNPATFTAAANTQASDYDKIMGMYSNLAAKSATDPLTSTSITPQLAQYSESPNVKGSLSNLSNLATTGGYSPEDIQNIRARDISPIRSIYSSAQQGLERQKALSGGYSPNFGAASAKMARDMSDIISNKTIDVNAGIAQNVAQNRLAAASPYASSSLSENAARTASDRANADIMNQIAETNANRALQAGQFNRSNVLGSIEGMRGLYGTTPALTSTFGNQVAQAAQLGQNQQQIDEQRLRDMMPMFRT
jgi:hypothetical protein